jgi:hypothetical protein
MARTPAKKKATEKEDPKAKKRAAPVEEDTPSPKEPTRIEGPKKRARGLLALRHDDKVSIRYPGDLSQSSDLRASLIRYADNKFPLSSSDGPEKTVKRILAQIWNGDRRLFTHFNSCLDDTYEAWATKSAAKYPKKTNEAALLVEFKKWFTIYVAYIKTSWYNLTLPSADVANLEDVTDMIVALSRKTYDGSLTNIIYAKKGAIRTKEKAMEIFETTFDVSICFCFIALF